MINLQTRVSDLDDEIDALVDYIHLKIKQRDWHGVSDAANDIREIEAQIKLFKLLISELEGKHQ